MSTLLLNVSEDEEESHRNTRNPELEKDWSEKRDEKVTRKEIHKTHDCCWETKGVFEIEARAITVGRETCLYTHFCLSTFLLSSDGNETV